MGLRFRKRIKLAPGLHLNFSHRSMGMSIGGRGASMSVNSRRGTSLTTGIPGTGLSYTSKLSGGASRKRVSTDRSNAGNSAAISNAAEQILAELRHYEANPPRVRFPAKEGAIELRANDGSELSERARTFIWEYCRNSVESSVREELEDRKRQIDLLSELHAKTPSPSPALEFRAVAFTEPPPLEPMPQRYHWFWKFFPAHRRRIDGENERREQRHVEEKAEWDIRRTFHGNKQREIAAYFASRDAGTPEGLEDFFAWHLGSLEWPRETSIDVSVSEDGGTLWCDVDLPEIEDLPDGYQELPARGGDIRWKDFSDSAKRKLYMAHVHGVGLRLAGECFRSCPAIKAAVISAYSQRENRKTGVVGDEYLFSVRISRERWATLNFASLAGLEPGEVLDHFELRRKVTKTGIFTPIEPFSVGDPSAA